MQSVLAEPPARALQLPTHRGARERASSAAGPEGARAPLRIKRADRVLNSGGVMQVLDRRGAAIASEFLSNIERIRRTRDG